MATPRLWRKITSVLSAFIGVQSRHRHEQDIADNDPWVLIVIGLILAALFAGVLMLVVTAVIDSAGH